MGKVCHIIIFDSTGLKKCEVGSFGEFAEPHVLDFPSDLNKLFFSFASQFKSSVQKSPVTGKVRVKQECTRLVLMNSQVARIKQRLPPIFFFLQTRFYWFYWSRPAAATSCVVRCLTSELAQPQEHDSQNAPYLITCLNHRPYQRSHFLSPHRCVEFSVVTLMFQRTDYIIFSF